jgi:hypothetical protein
LRGSLGADDAEIMMKNKAGNLK